LEPHTRPAFRPFQVLRVLALASLAAALAASAPIATGKVRKDITAAAVRRKWVIATVVKVDGLAWFDRMRVGINQFKADTGHETWMVGPAMDDAVSQVQIIEDLIARKVDAICVVPFSVEAVEPVLRKAREKGIVVIAHEASNIQNADYTLEAFDNKAYGAKLMEVLGQAMGGRGKYVCTVGSLTSKSQNEWIDGGIEYQKEHFPQMREVAKRLETFDDARTDYTRLKEILAAYPDLKGVLGGPMPTSAGAGRLIAERNLSGRLFFAGTGLVSVAGQYLRNGNIQYIQFWDPAVAGYAMDELAVLALSGKKREIKAGLNLGLEGYARLTTPDPRKPNLLYGAGWIGVTKASVDKYDF
jgi:simple sugar transport system substrate-binding protein